VRDPQSTHTISSLDYLEKTTLDWIHQQKLEPTELASLAEALAAGDEWNRILLAVDAYAGVAGVARAEDDVVKLLESTSPQNRIEVAGTILGWIGSSSGGRMVTREVLVWLLESFDDSHEALEHLFRVSTDDFLRRFAPPHAPYAGITTIRQEPTARVNFEAAAYNEVVARDPMVALRLRDLEPAVGRKIIEETPWSEMRTNTLVCYIMRQSQEREELLGALYQRLHEVGAPQLTSEDVVQLGEVLRESTNAEVLEVLGLSETGAAMHYLLEVLGKDWADEVHLRAVVNLITKRDCSAWGLVRMNELSVGRYLKLLDIAPGVAWSELADTSLARGLVVAYHDKQIDRLDVDTNTLRVLLAQGHVNTRLAQVRCDREVLAKLFEDRLGGAWDSAISLEEFCEVATAMGVVLEGSGLSD
jgi:hypothetical protein